MQEHDLVVIGAGPGGYVAAIRAAQLGLNVGCVEKEAALGGTCLRIGCIPSKALLESSERFQEARDSLATHGVNVGKVELDLAKMLKRQNDIVAGLAKGVESLLKKNKITRHLGHGRLVGPGRVNVEGPGGLVEIKAKHIVIATGSKPGSLRGAAPDGRRVGTSTEALGYGSVPGHLVVIGAGSIGLELGSAWRRLGARVTVLEFLDRILPGMDSELALEAQKLFTKQGLEFRLESKVLAAQTIGEQASVEYEGGEPIRCDQVLVAVGRVPNTDDLGLDAVGIRLDEKGRIPVNGNFATSVDGIYAIGDVIAGPMLAHKAEEDGIACAEWLATGRGHVNYETIPNIVYTHPEFAGVGKTEDDLKQSGAEYRKGTFPFSGNGRARALGQIEGRVKVLADARTDRLLGVHILGARAGDLIAEAATAMAFGASSEDIARTCHAHPTLSEAFREAALAVDKRVIHG
jgi:dihydrolipoamide dehydrogenase